MLYEPEAIGAYAYAPEGRRNKERMKSTGGGDERENYDS
jgi:hypothetical protein